MTGADLTVLVPMLGRPHRVVPLLASVRATVPDAEVLWLCTPGDRSVLAEVARVGGRCVTVPYDKGDYARKVNVGYRESDRLLLFLGAADLQFHPGWYEAATAELRDWAVGVVGTNDLGSPRVMAGDHATHSLVTRAYADVHGTIDQPGAILHEGYWHEFVDDELVATARHRGAWAFAEHAHVEHLHPDHGKAPNDPLYRRRPARMRAGRTLFRAREHLWT